MLQATRLDSEWLDSMEIDTSTLNFWESLEEEYSDGGVDSTQASRALFSELLQVMLANVEYILTPAHVKGISYF